MIDQATRLRGLMESRDAFGASSAAVAEPEVVTSAVARVIAVTSGKGGVGKSSIALNIAIALRRTAARVCLIDANLGLSNIDLLCGLNGYWNLSHVIAGSRGVADVILNGPEGIDVISGAGSLTELRDNRHEHRADIVRQTTKLEERYDYLVIDAGTGTFAAVKRFAAAADVALVVTTPEPTSIADAYAAVKGLSVTPPRNLMVIVNQAESTGQASSIINRMRRTSGLFLHTDIDYAGHIPHDRQLVQSVARRIPLLVDSPRCPSAEAINAIARRVKSSADGSPPRGGFFHRVTDESRAPVS